MRTTRIEAPLLTPPLLDADVSSCVHTSAAAPDAFLTAATAAGQGLVLTPAQRARLLRQYGTRIGADAAAQKNAAALAAAAAVTVVTGQQAGLFTGPLYTIYKAVTAINLARRLARDLHRPVVPIFWHASEDHDLSEMRHCHFPDHTFSADFPAGGLAAEAQPTAPCAAAAAELLQAVAGSPAADAVAELLQPAGNDYGAQSAAWLARLFRDTGLVVVEPRLFRAAAVPFLRRCLQEPETVRRALAAGAAALRDIGQQPTFEPGDESTGVFHIAADGVRRHILRHGDGYIVDGRPAAAVDVLTALAADPGSFSTGAYLRPILQALMLPDVAMICGPSEFRYHLQLRPLYEHFGVRMPVLRLRNHATLIGPREERLATALGLRPEDFLRGGPDACRRAPELPASQEAALRAAETRAKDLGRILRNDLGELVDPRTLAAFDATISRELGRLRDKAGKAWKRKTGVDNGRIDRLFACVRPRNRPQERRINVFYFLQFAGPGLARRLLDTFDPDDARHYLMYTG